MEPNQTIDFLKSLLERQENMYQLLIMVLIGITTLLVGSTWLWNFFIAKKQISLEVEKKFKTYETKTDLKITEIQTGFNTLIIDTINLKYTEVYIDISRLFAVLAKDKQMFSISLSWWTKCLQNSIDLKNDKLTRVSLNNIEILLNEKDFTSISSDIIDIESTLTLIKKLPELLYDEKNRVIKQMKNLKVTES